MSIKRRYVVSWSVRAEGTWTGEAVDEADATRQAEQWVADNLDVSGCTGLACVVSESETSTPPSMHGGHGVLAKEIERG